MDGEYYCRLAKAGYRFRFFPVTVAAFSWHDGNVSSVLLEQRRAEWVGLRKKYMPLPKWVVRKPWRAYRRTRVVGHFWRRVLILFRLTLHRHNNGDLRHA